jgi:hypothetical protein
VLPKSPQPLNKAVPRDKILSIIAFKGKTGIWADKRPIQCIGSPVWEARFLLLKTLLAVMA